MQSQLMEEPALISGNDIEVTVTRPPDKQMLRWLGLVALGLCMAVGGFVLLLLPREKLWFDYSGREPLIVSVEQITWLPICGTGLIVCGVLVVQIGLVCLVVFGRGRPKLG